MRHIFHLVEVINHIDSSIDQIQISTELGTTGIKHIGQQSQLVFISVVRYQIVLVGQLHILHLRTQVGKRSEEIDISCLYRVFHLFLSQTVSLFGLADIQLGLFEFTVVLE